MLVLECGLQFTDAGVEMDPLIGLSLALELFADGQSFYLERPKTLCQHPPGYVRYCDDVREYIIPQDVEFGVASSSS